MVSCSCNYRSMVSPCPSCPFAPLPQEYTFSGSVTAIVCLHPHEIRTTFCQAKQKFAEIKNSGSLLYTARFFKRKKREGSCRFKYLIMGEVHLHGRGTIKIVTNSNLSELKWKGETGYRLQFTKQKPILIKI